MKKKRFGVEQIVGVLKPGGSGSTGRRVDPEGWDQRADVLSVEGEVRWSRGRSGAPDETVAGREPAVEAVGGRADAEARRCFRTCSQKNGKAFAAWTDGGASGKYLPSR